MSRCFQSLLQELRPFIPGTLIDDEWLKRLAERVGHLPGMAAARMTALEVRLGDPAPAADCAFAAGPDRPLSPHYIRRGEAAPAGSPAARLGRLLAGLADPGPGSQPGDHRGGFDSVLLEYDVVEVPPGQHPEPGLFLKLRPEPEAPGTLAAATDAIAQTMGWQDRAVGGALARACTALPAGARVGNLGAMPDRAPPTVKVLAVGIAAERIGRFLEGAGWPGPMDRVAPVLEAMRPVASLCALSLDVTEKGLLPRLGLEFAPPAMAKGAAAWRPVTERLAELGWCLAGKKRGLMDFPGIEKVFSDEGVLMLCKGIGHVKLTVAEGTDAVSAKAYIGISYIPFSAYPARRARDSEPPSRPLSRPAASETAPVTS